MFPIYFDELGVRCSQVNGYNNFHSEEGELEKR